VILFLEKGLRMIHHIVLYKPKPDVTAQQLEVIMMQTRIQLLKISFASNVRCGRRIDKANEWAFFVAIDFDSKERLAMFHDDAIYIKFVEEIIKPNMASSLVLDYDGDPRRK
jgi:Stress responsive A/B Barrel Domain